MSLNCILALNLIVEGGSMWPLLRISRVRRRADAEGRTLQYGAKYKAIRIFVDVAFLLYARIL